MDTKTKKVPIFEEPHPHRADVHRKSCSIYSIIALLLLIFLIIIGALIYVKINGLKISSPIIKNPINQTVDIKEQTQNEPVSIKITDSQLEDIINSTGSNFPLKKNRVTISPQGILVKGKTSNNLLGLSVEIALLPKVADGKISYEISSIKTAGLNAPKKIEEELSQKLNSYLSDKDPLQKDLTVEKIELSDGYLVLTGRKR